MYLETRDTIDRPLDEVYQLVRDDLPKIVPYLQNIKKIDVVHFAHKGPHLTETINHWYANIDIPSVAQKFIKEELFSWKDTAFWHNDQYFVEYQLESFWANDLYKAQGKNTFTALSPQKTELKITCEVTIFADKVPGVPKFLVKKVLPSVEELIRKILQPNLSGLGQGLAQYFSQLDKNK